MVTYHPHIALRHTGNLLESYLILQPHAWPYEHFGDRGINLIISQVKLKCPLWVESATQSVVEFVVPRPGFEPGTSGLGIGSGLFCATSSNHQP